MLWEDVGLGKTIQMLTAFIKLRDALDVTTMLVVAPLRIIQSVWKQEAEKWDHTRHLRFSLIHGTPNAREAALRRRADIYLINYENLPWLAVRRQHLYLR
jgi:SNF2 family DNA or RNA helicase